MTNAPQRTALVDPTPLMFAGNSARCAAEGCDVRRPMLRKRFERVKERLKKLALDCGLL